MALVRICRTAARGGASAYVPGGASCAASGRRLPFTPTRFRLSTTLQRTTKSAVVRLAAVPAG